MWDQGAFVEDLRRCPDPDRVIGTDIDDETVPVDLPNYPVEGFLETYHGGRLERTEPSTAQA